MQIHVGTRLFDMLAYNTELSSAIIICRRNMLPKHFVKGNTRLKLSYIRVQTD